jgi:hypothetical protein
MIALARNLDGHQYAPRTYVIANTDSLSEVKARQLEHDRSGVEHKDVSEKEDHILHKMNNSITDDQILTGRYHFFFLVLCIKNTAIKRGRTTA